MQYAVSSDNKLFIYLIWILSVNHRTFHGLNVKVLHRTFPMFSTTSRGNNEQMTKLEQDFDLGEPLGQGGFGQIIKAKRKCDDIEFAVKIIRFDSNKEDVEKIRREAKMLSKLNHSNIVRYFNSWIQTAHIPVSEYKKLRSESDESLSSELKKLSSEGFVSRDDVIGDDIYFDDYCSHYEDEEYDKDDYEEEEEDGDKNTDLAVSLKPEFIEVKYLLIQMELCENRTLRDAIDSNLYLEEARLMKYFKEICEGLSFIHKNNIVHRDLKPENICLTSNDVIKIGDFGLSKQITKDSDLEGAQSDDIPYGSLTATCGTTIYVAPELHGKASFNLKADIYSLGIIYFEMCSPPMTGMEKSKTFPLTDKRLKTTNFPNNTSKKKFLIKSLVHLDHHERPTCDEILKILNSDKSIDEIKEIIKQKKKVPSQHYETFAKYLRSNTSQKINSRTLFLTAAVKIFELHGGQNIPMPTFIPTFSYHDDNLTTMLNSHGNSVSITNTSRIPFCYYLAKNSIQKIRRYSIGRVFEEGIFSPTELQECVFQAVSPRKKDYVTDAEMLYMTKEICNRVSLNDVYFVINHERLYSTILKHCKMGKKTAALFTNMMMDMNHVGTTLPPLCFSGFNFSEEVRLFLQTMMQLYTVTDAQEVILHLFRNNTEKEAFARVNTKVVTWAFKQLQEFIANANKFGVTKILVLPLSTNLTNSTGILFKVVHNKNKVIASGGRFESLIRRQIKKRRTFNVSAVEVSFNVENVLHLLTSSDENYSVVDVTVVSSDKSMAISLCKELLAHEIKCEIVSELVTESGSNYRPEIVIQLTGEYHGTVYQVQGKGFPWKLTELFSGNLKSEKFSDIVNDKFHVGPLFRDDLHKYLQYC